MHKHRAFSFKPHHIERAAEGSEPWRSALVPWPSWAKKQIQDELKGSDIPTMRLPLHIQWKFALRSPTSSSGKCPPGPSSLRLPSNRRPPPLPPFANKPKQLCKLPVASPPKFVDDFFSKSSPLTTHSIDLDPFSSLSDDFLLMDGDSPVNFHLPPDSPDKRARVPLAHSPVKRQKQKPKGRPPSPHPMAIRRPHQSSNQPNQSNQSDQPNQPNHPHGKPVPRRGGISPTGAADILQSLQSPRTAILQSQSLRKKLKVFAGDKASPPLLLRSRRPPADLFYVTRMSLPRVRHRSRKRTRKGASAAPKPSQPLRSAPSMPRMPPRPPPTTATTSKSQFYSATTRTHNPIQECFKTRRRRSPRPWRSPVSPPNCVASPGPSRPRSCPSAPHPSKHSSHSWAASWGAGPSLRRR